MLARVLLVLIALATGFGVVVWIVRSQPFGPADPVGSPLSSTHPAAAGWQQGSEAPFARLEMGIATLDGRIWLAGGRTWRSLQRLFATPPGELKQLTREELEALVRIGEHLTTIAAQSSAAGPRKRRGRAAAG